MTSRFNPWRGCQKVTDGCKHCYAETRSKRFGEDFSGQRIRLSDAGWKEPLKWNRIAAVAHASQLGPTQQPRVFCASLADIFEDWDGVIHNHLGEPLNHRLSAPVDNMAVTAMTMNDLRRDLFKLINQTPWLDWIILTKRPENIRRMWGHVSATLAHKNFDAGRERLVYRPNVWLVTSASEQETADRNWGHLVGEGGLTPVIGLSLEPLLGPIDIWQSCRNGPAPNWVIVGGESGPNARPCDIAWIRSIAQQCRELDVPCFVKQLGSCSITRWDDPAIASLATAGQATSDTVQLGEHWQVREHSETHGRICFKHSKGGDIEEFPEDIRVREFPAGSEQPEGGPATKQ